MYKNVKKIVIIGFAVLVAVLALTSPLFIMRSHTNTLSVSITSSGYDVITDHCLFDAEIITLLWTVGFAVAFINAARSIFSNDDKLSIKLLELALVCLFFSATFYFIDGQIWFDSIDLEELSKSETVSSYAIIPFIFALVTFIAYVIVKIIFNIKDKKYSLGGEGEYDDSIEKNQSKMQGSYLGIEQLEMLTKYKEMMDNGILTPEEYYRAKERLLRK